MFADKKSWKCAKVMLDFRSKKEWGQNTKALPFFSPSPLRRVYFYYKPLQCGKRWEFFRLFPDEMHAQPFFSSDPCVSLNLRGTSLPKIFRGGEKRRKEA